MCKCVQDFHSLSVGGISKSLLAVIARRMVNESFPFYIAIFSLLKFIRVSFTFCQST